MHAAATSQRMTVAQAEQILSAVSAIISPAYLVGGSVRDVLLGRECGDIDIATPLDPDTVEMRVRAAGRRPYLVGKKFGTVAFKLDGRTIEVTTFRAETYANSSRKPAVTFVDELAEDLSRRDFTINAMALDDSGVIDPFGGRADLEGRVIRAVGNACERFAEDPLRMLRAARFSAELGFSVEPGTVEAMRQLAERILLVARERWVVELDRLLVAPGAAQGLRLLADTGLLTYLLPEVALQIGCRESASGEGDSLFEHTLSVVSVVEPEVTLRWAALLHDVGRPYLRAGERGCDAHGSAGLLGGELVERIALYLKWGNRRREDVKRLVAERTLESSPLRAIRDAAGDRRPNES